MKNTNIKEKIKLPKNMKKSRIESILRSAEAIHGCNLIGMELEGSSYPHRKENELVIKQLEGLLAK